MNLASQKKKKSKENKCLTYSFLGLTLGLVNIFCELRNF